MNTVSLAFAFCVLFQDAPGPDLVKAIELQRGGRHWIDQPTDPPKSPEESRIFPLLLSKISKIFEFKESKFGIQKSKEATARVAMWKELKNVPLIYTMESTFSGMTINEYNGQHIDIGLLEQMGRDLCRTLLVHQNISLP